MYYWIKQYDEPLVRFNMDIHPLNGLTVTLLFANQERKSVFPLDLTLTDAGMKDWLLKRIVPINRTHVHEMLKALNLSYNDRKGIIDISRGLSLNDSYWIVPETFAGTFREYNLYQNAFSKELAHIAYTGMGGNALPFTLSPELTTNGALPKAWRSIDGAIYLYKGGTSGMPNFGLEPYSEYYAAQIAQAMGLNTLAYDLTYWKSRLCSVCKLFTDLGHSYVPISTLIKGTNLSEVLECTKQLGPLYHQSIISILVFDAVIYNDDRHLGNWGVIRDNRTGEIVYPSCVFDNSLSLFNYALMEDLQDWQGYAKNRPSSTGSAHEEIAAIVMGDLQRKQLRSLLHFKFVKHALYNLPDKRLAILEGFIQKQAEALLRL